VLAATLGWFSVLAQDTGDGSDSVQLHPLKEAFPGLFVFYWQIYWNVRYFFRHHN